MEIIPLHIYSQYKYIYFIKVKLTLQYTNLQNDEYHTILSQYTWHIKTQKNTQVNIVKIEK